MPRPYVKMGLPGPGQDLFPEGAREVARGVGLYPGEIVILRHGSNSSAGAVRDTYTADAQPVRGRVDPTSSNTAGGLRGGVVQDESAEQLVSFENGQAITIEDRLRFADHDWLITSIRERTDELIVRCEVRWV